MNTMDAIYSRRSVRKFSEESVSSDDLKKIIAAGMMAPSAGNQQPWHFITITDKEKLAEVGNVNPNAKMASGAPAAIMVCGDLELEKHPGYWIQDCSAAVQNMLLAVHAMDLGAVWTGTWPVTQRVEGFRAMLNLPKTVNPLALIIIGHPVENTESGAQKAGIPDRYREDRIHKETW